MSAPSAGAEVDLYAPWREGAEALAQRHVGRERELDAIRSATRAFARGSSPLPLYVFGSSGVGKSHLLSVARAAVGEILAGAAVEVTVVPEDTVAVRAPEELFGIMTAGVPRAPWTSWNSAPAGATPEAKRRVVLFESLDRQLRALGLQGRRRLRQLLGDGPEMWIVGAGMTLPQELTAADEAFFAAFDPWPLDPLDAPDAALLLDRIAGESGHDPSWRALRSTLVTLAGGSPRSLCALGLARRREPDRGASELLHRVVHEFTAQYRNKLRDLSPQAQRIVTLLAAAPRELGPSELAPVLDTSTTQMSVQARRLLEEGVLRHRSDGRQTWYRLADPLFRYWLEYMNARWDETRASWQARLLSSLHPIPERPASSRGPARWRAARDELLQAVAQPPSRERAGQALTRVSGAPLHAAAAREVLLIALEHDLGDVAEAAIGEAVRAAGWGELGALLALDAAIRGGPAASRAPAPREAFMALVRALIDAPIAGIGKVVAAMLGRGARARPWTLRGPERRDLARAPHLRATFLRHGRALDQAALIDARDVIEQLEAEPPDAAELVVAALDTKSAPLLEHAARSLAELPRCHRPMRLDEGASAVVGAALSRMLATPPPGGLRDALSWAASFARMPEPLFASLLEPLAAASRALPHYGDYVEDVALAALLAAAPERFDALAQAIARTHRGVCEQARLLAAQLAEAERGDLHPELAAVAEAIA
jgi:hypothetical protein